MRQRAPAILIAIAVLALVGWYVAFTKGVVDELRRETRISGQMYARIYRTLGDTADAAGTSALFDLSRHIIEMGVPVIVTDETGRPTAAANLPFDVASIDDPRVREYLRELDRANPPVEERGSVTVHFGLTPVVDQMRTIPVLQVVVLGLLLGLAFWLLIARERAGREQVWAGMAREAAHQLGTPLSSLSGWIEVLKDRGGDPVLEQALDHMATDLERLERVAHRFERIGRPPRMEVIDVGAIVVRIAEYFRARVPSLAHPITLETELAAPGPLTVHGDSVLLEWVVEALAKNAIDALAGRGGTIHLLVAPLPEGGVKVRVADNGPGVPRDLRTRVFDPGFSTKQRGWGIGLSLARRIVEETHRGKLQLVPGGGGAVFDVILPA
ncbi:MAG: HAMP domain-containing histidine kinase [Gemmatimonadetes bacterium]|nr:HAMP domain-containing histidine kinase [Gemmatimonadota bacterium]